MLDEKIVKIANERIQIEIKEQNENLQGEIDRIVEEMGAKGTLYSGMTIARVTNSCLVAIKYRAQFIWQTLFRFITTAGISYYDKLADDLKMLVAGHLPIGTLQDRVRKIAELARAPRPFTHVESELDSVRTSALAKVGTEIDLFVHSLKKKVEMEERKAASTVFNIYSPVGAIQMGDSSIANVTQTIDIQIREQLTKVLEEIAVELSHVDVMMPHPKGEIIELAREGQEELKKSTPNITKLRSVLSAVGNSIQTVASMKTAYETLKVALTFLGISLP